MVNLPLGIRALVLVRRHSATATAMGLATLVLVTLPATGCKKLLSRLSEGHADAGDAGPVGPVVDFVGRCANETAGTPDTLVAAAPSLKS